MVNSIVEICKFGPVDHKKILKSHVMEYILPPCSMSGPANMTVPISPASLSTCSSMAIMVTGSEARVLCMPCEW